MYCYLKALSTSVIRSIFPPVSFFIHLSAASLPLDLTLSRYINSKGGTDQRNVLIDIQEMYLNGDTTPDVKAQIKEMFETVGVYLAHAAAQHKAYLGIENVIIFGQVVTGPLGEVVRQKAQQVLDHEYSDLGITIHITEDPAFAQAIGVGYLSYSP